MADAKTKATETKVSLGTPDADLNPKKEKTSFVLFSRDANDVIAKDSELRLDDPVISLAKEFAGFYKDDLQVTKITASHNDEGGEVNIYMSNLLKVYASQLLFKSEEPYVKINFIPPTKNVFAKYSGTILDAALESNPMYKETREVGREDGIIMYGIFSRKHIVQCANGNLGSYQQVTSLLPEDFMKKHDSGNFQFCYCTEI